MSPRARWLVVAYAAVVVAAVALYAAVHASPSTSPPAPPARVAPSPSAAIAAPTAPSSASPPAPAATWQPSARDLAARTAREQLLARSRDDRAAAEPWDDAGLAVLDDLAQHAVSTRDRGCYMAGCLASFTFASQGDYQRALDRVTASPAYQAWTGGKQLTPPESLADGRVVIAVLLGRPD